MSLYTKIIDIQKLDVALQKAAKNKPAAGADGVTYDMFLDNKREYLKQLHLELAEHRYHPRPVKLAQLYQGEKERTIALYSMRDKVVQQSAAAELQKLYEPLFSNACYAYRSGRSALEAVGKLEKYMAGQGGWVLRMDIHSFFDSIPQDRLLAKLRSGVREEDVLEMIMENACAKYLEPGGNLAGKERGIWQGSAIAPVLSNIYLKDFDFAMEQKARFFLRYSDDMVAIAESEAEAGELLEFAEAELKKYGLTFNEAKTGAVAAEQGVDFLGYHFNAGGKSVPVKAERELADRLEEMFFASSALTVKERLKKGAEILGGWEQYYRDEREIHSILEYAVVLYMIQLKDEPVQKKIRSMRPRFHNTYRELAGYMAKFWKEQGCRDLELLEYEQLYDLYQIDGDCIRDYESPFVKELLEGYRKLTAFEDQDTLAELIQDYTELRCFNRASRLMERYQRMEKAEHEIPESPAGLSEEEAASVQTGKINTEGRRLFYDLFVGREDTYAEESIGVRRLVEQKHEPLTDEVLREHLSGRCTICTYVQRPNSTAKYLVFDLDVSKKILLKYPAGSKEIEQYKNKCFQVSCKAANIFEKLGLKGYLENSGFRGYHIWIFFTEWMPVRYINALSEVLMKKMEEILEEGIDIECFPDERRMRPGKAGQSIKLPLGVNPKSGGRGYFLDEDFRIAEDLELFFKGIAKFSLSAVRKVIDMCAGECRTALSPALRDYMPDPDLEVFGRLSEEVRTVLERCNLMRYLCQKAQKTGYLTHFERLSVLHVLGHMGDEGKEFVHQVMGYTLNYQYQTTQKFINRIPEKPVSCVKLREQYRQITAEIGCSCNFKRTKNCYPSPVLHALKSADTESGQITIPSSRSLSKEKEQTVYQEVNVYRKVQELAERILEMKRQKRGIDKKIAKTERELESVFDGMKADCLEIEMGLLCRRRKEDGSYEWVIEI